ncbi:MAG TPA: thiolase family protein [Candidatus Nitrosotalea sp.]|nr:thiolase family protein [Candidatus Nitrosotalea sp.]
MEQAVIVEAVRSPVGKRNGRLSQVHPVNLSATVLRALMERSGVQPEAVDQVLWGCVTQVGEQATNVGRNSWLAAGFPFETPATSLDTQCGSSQQAIHLGAALIQGGVAEVVVAGGVESMSRIPMGSDAQGGPGVPFPPELLERFELVPQGISAEYVARKYDVSRLQMDEFSVLSHQLAAAATAAGHLRTQLVAMAPDGVPMVQDEGIRADASLDAVGRLRPAFDPGHSITAGNASQISDGAAAVLLMSAGRAQALGLRPRARIRAQAVVGCDPVLMLEGPIPATAKVLGLAGLELSQIDLYEINEAFACVPLAWLKVTAADPARLNVNGGAIAIGHPLGASGARLMTQLLYELERREQRYGLQAMCVGGGIGTATVIERDI